MLLKWLNKINAMFLRRKRIKQENARRAKKLMKVASGSIEKTDDSVGRKFWR